MKTLLSRLSILVIALVAGVSTTSAINFELGQVYPVVDMQVEGTVTLPTSGDLYMTGGDAAVNVDGAGPESLGFGGQLGSIWVWRNMTAGVHTVSTRGIVLANDRFMFYMEGIEELAVRECVPAAGSVVSATVNGTGEILVFFNSPVMYTASYLVASGHTSGSLGSGSMAAQMLAVKVGPTLNSFYQQGYIAAEGGTPVSLVIEGIHTSGGTVYGTNGTLQIDFVASRKALQLVSATIHEGQEFLSYYTKGDSRGIYTLTFDGDLSSAAGHVPYATFGVGDVENESTYYYEEILGVVDGPSVTFDLTGVNRRPAIAAVGVEDGALIGFKVANVFDETLNPAAGGSEANPGSYPYTLVYKAVPEQPIAFQFIPGNGGSLADTEKLNLWFNNAGVIESVDGVSFTYADGTSDFIPYGDLVNESTEAGECEFNIAVPQRARTEGVDVTLANIVSRDGYDKLIRASYNKFVITYCSPFKEGGYYDKIEADPWLNDTGDPLIRVRANYASKYPELFLYYVIDDVTTGEYIHSNDMRRQDDGTYTGVGMIDDYTLVSGHTYRFTVTAWENEATAQPDKMAMQNTLGSYSINFFGTGKGFGYSTVKYVGIEPDNGQAIDALTRVFTVTYDGLVMIDPEDGINGVAIGQGMGLTPYVSVVAVDDDPDNGGYSSVWALTVADESMTGRGVTLNVRAVDQLGFTVESNTGVENALDYMSVEFFFITEEGPLELTVTPDGDSTDELLTEIAIVCAEQMAYTYEKNVTLVNVDTNETLLEAGLDGYFSSWGYNGDFMTAGPGYCDDETRVKLVFDPALDRSAAAYRLIIPAGAFVDSFYSRYNDEIVVTYASLSGVGPVVTDIDGAYEVYDAMGRKVLHTDDVEALRNLRPGFYIINGSKYLLR